jgi:hypothetical protein
MKLPKPGRLADEIPVKRFEMPEIEHKPVTFGNRPIIQGVRSKQPK